MEPTVQLPPPQGAAAKRGQALFSRFMAVERRRRDEKREVDQQEASVGTSGSALPKRCYDVALSVLAQLDPEGAAREGVESSTHDEDLDVPHTRLGVTATMVGAEVPPLFAAALEKTVSRTVLNEDLAPQLNVQTPHDLPDDVPPVARPPVGAPTVRASVPEPIIENSDSRTRARELIQQGASGLMSVDAGAEGVGFDISFSDDVFVDLRCRITIADGVVAAVFFAPDVHTRRLLEAESGRLRVSLEERGLRVSAIKIEMC